MRYFIIIFIILIFIIILLNFRSVCLKEYELDPCYFVSAPNLSCQACLKKTNLKLELPTDINMLLLFKKGIRGGISQAITKYEKQIINT